MKIGLLKTDEIPPVLQDKHGDFDFMFQKMLFQLLHTNVLVYVYAFVG